MGSRKFEATGVVSCVPSTLSSLGGHEQRPQEPRKLSVTHVCETWCQTLLTQQMQDKGKGEALTPPGPQSSRVVLPVLYCIDVQETGRNDYKDYVWQVLGRCYDGLANILMFAF